RDRRRQGREGDPPRRRAGLPRVRSGDRVAGRVDPPGVGAPRRARPVRRKPADRDADRAALPVMTGYSAIVAARFRCLLQYRAAALAGLFTQLVFGLVRVMIFEAFYAAGGGRAAMSLSEVVGYVWLGQATLLLMPWRLDEDVNEQIRTGTVVY